MTKRIIFIDGHCNLCSGFVDWVFRRDKKKAFQFASLQGHTASELLRIPINLQDPTSVVYLRDNSTLQMSDAVLYVLLDLGGFWSCAKIFFCIPRPIRNWIYQLVAKNRYLIFGKRETCRTPTAAEKSRFLD